MSVSSVMPCIVVAWMALSVAVGPAAGPKPPVNQGDQGIAIRGYDPVAYAVTGTATRGTPQFQHQWNGAVWRFASVDNRDKFARNPEKYAPQFGGYCSWAVSRGYTADIDPEAWKIVDGRLYLNYSKSVQRRWEQDIPGNLAKGQANWPAVLNK